MGLIEDILREKGGDLVAELTGKAGFSADQAEAFVPEAGTSVMKALAKHGSELDLGNLASAANVASLMKSVDIGRLAGLAGVSKDAGSQGMAALLPLLLRFIGDKGGNATALLGLLGAAGGNSSGLGALKGIAGKFLK